jgi:parallel beta-helix repeat protein
MRRKPALVLILFALFFSMPYVKFSSVDVKVSDGFRVHNIDTGIGYTTIQEAIDASETLDGHTIFVEEGIYHEHVVVDKSISLIGENRSNTVIDGDTVGKAVKITANNTKISGFTIQRAGFTPWGSDSGIYVESSDNVVTDNIIVNNDDWGIWLNSSSSNNTITYNNITDNWRGCMLMNALGNNLIGNDITNHGQDGIYVWNSSNNIISANNISENVHGISLDSSYSNNLTGNKIMDNLYGISLLSSSNNMLRNNVLKDNSYGLEVGGFLYLGNQLSYFIQDIDASNTVNERPICYWVNHHNEQVALDAGFVGLVSCTNITVRNLNLKNNALGMVLACTNNSQIQNLNITNNDHGIYLYHSFGNTIFDSHISNNHVGISLETSFGNDIVYNRVTEADEGILLSYSSNNNVAYNNIANNKYRGVFVGLSSENNIAYNNITDNEMAGIEISSDGIGTLENNSIHNNNLINNTCGVRLGDTSGNKCYQNNFINNTKQASVYISIGSVGYGNVWDNGMEGNYWSDYNGTDSDHNGIGDTPYIIDENNQDNYPLMGLFYEFNAFLGYPVNVISNSTIEVFEYFELNGTIKMYVSNMTTNQMFGFCRVCIPYELMAVINISVIIDDGDTTVLYPNYNVYDNSTHRWIYFAYEHSIHKIDIIPEHSSVIILQLFMTATLLAVIAHRRKHFT